MIIYRFLILYNFLYNYNTFNNLNFNFLKKNKHIIISKVIFKGEKCLKIKLSTQTVKKSDFQVAKEILKPDIVVLSEIKELDNLLGGFKSGEVTYIDGDSDLIQKIPNQICVNTYRSFRNDIVYIDGGMSADPYKIAKYAKKIELNQKELLEHIHISRAFTVYQLTTQIQEMLEQAIKRYHPQTLIINRFPILYLDSDVETKEAKALLRSNIHKIKELTKKYDLITVFTNLDKELLSHNRNINKILYHNVDEIVLIKQDEHATFIELLNKKKKTIIPNLVKGQARLSDFWMVI